MIGEEVRVSPELEKAWQVAIERNSEQMRKWAKSPPVFVDDSRWEMRVFIFALLAGLIMGTLLGLAIAGYLNAIGIML